MYILVGNLFFNNQQSSYGSPSKPSYTVQNNNVNNNFNNNNVPNNFNNNNVPNNFNSMMTSMNGINTVIGAPQGKPSHDV